MPLFVTSLASGSNGNCYYIGNDTEAVLVDAGISCRDTERRMKRLGLPLSKVKAIFISHEHIDHIKGVEVIARKYQLPVYINTPTLQNVRISLDAHLLRNIEVHKPVMVGGLLVTAFPKHHDAAEPCSFIVAGAGITVGVFTDIGIALHRHVIQHFSRCHAAFLEANYDEVMLQEGGYPLHLKNRIRGGKGHLSNMQALDIFSTHRPPFMTHLLLSHLSKNNNDPQLVYDLFSRHAAGVHIVIASRYKETEVFRIEASPSRQHVVAKQPVQATLF